MSSQARSIRKLRRVREVAQTFGCHICLEPYMKKECRVAPCGHSCCVDCWQTMSRPLLCPLCRTPAPTPTPNYALNELMSEVRSTLKERYRSDEAQLNMEIRKVEKRMKKEDANARKKKA